MKKGNDYIVFKYVYRSVNGIWLRDDHTTLYDEFSYIDHIAELCPSFKITMNKPNYELVSWKDKHNNIIVRIINKSFKQSKIIFL